MFLIFNATSRSYIDHVLMSDCAADITILIHCTHLKYFELYLHDFSQGDTMSESKLVGFIQKLHSGCAPGINGIMLEYLEHVIYYLSVMF